MEKSWSGIMLTVVVCAAKRSYSVWLQPLQGSADGLNHERQQHERQKQVTYEDHGSPGRVCQTGEKSSLEIIETFSWQQVLVKFI